MRRVLARSGRRRNRAIPAVGPARRFFAAATGLLALAGCAGIGETIQFASSDPAFVDSLGQAAPRTVEGGFAAPGTAPPWPAVVMLHQSLGQGRQDRAYAERLTAAGYAVLAVDSFGPRGVERTIEDQAAVGESAMIADAYGALRRLQADPRIDGRRIALLGFSKGGIAAFYAGLRSIAERAAPGGERFAGHIAFYPWCGLVLRDPRAAGPPILILAGDADDVAPPALCRDRIAEIERADPAARIDLVLYPGARHAFDHPMLAWFGRLPAGGQMPRECLIVETAPDRFVERKSGLAVTSATIRDALEACAVEGGTAGGDDAAAADAMGRVLAFLAAHLSRAQ